MLAVLQSMPAMLMLSKTYSIFGENDQDIGKTFKMRGIRPVLRTVKMQMMQNMEDDNKDATNCGRSESKGELLFLPVISFTLVNLDER